MKYRFRTRPYRHQVKAVRHLFAHNGGALFMEMGTGKTKICIDFAAAVATRHNPKTPCACALVVAPLNVLGVWEKEIAIHDPYADKEWLGVEWRIINYDKVWRPHFYDELAEWLDGWKDRGPRIIIADESHRIKNHAARRSKAMHRLGQHADYRVVGTGTAITKGPLDLFSQFKFLDEGIFGNRFQPFKRMYSVTRPGTPIIVRYQNLKQLKRKIRPYMYTQKLDDCVDVPTARHKMVPVELTGDAARTYEELAREAITEFRDLEVDEQHVLTRLLRLQQITGGWLATKLPDETKVAKRVGADKLLVYKDLLEDLQASGREKVVVFARFLREMKDIAYVTRKQGYKVLTIHGGNRALRERIYTAFGDSDQPTVLICQISTGALGRNELVVARDAVFYSTDFSFDNFDQALGRLRRPGQKHKVMYWHLLAEGTVDYAVLMSLKEKRKLAELVLRYPKLVYNQPSNGE